MRLDPLKHAKRSSSRWSAWLLLAGAFLPALAAEPLLLRFADFFAHPVGRHGLAPGPRLLAADGQRVRIVGYMVATEDPQPGRFLLTPLPLRMSEHADGDADDLPPATLAVWLHSTQQALALPHRSGPIALTGVLRYGRHAEPDGRIVWVGLQLDADAVLPPSQPAALPATFNPPTTP